ncbi:unnamed protein product [Durusdinium trenchii]|uniref:Uncharacterized protein n=1 Tax=Durusdinium trenchii TaxID=1381693 RepID=A0ABP0K1D6_9DINO
MCVRTCAAIVCTTSPGIRIHFPVVELFGCTMMRIFFFGCAAHCIGWEFSVSFKTSQQSPLNRSMRDKKEESRDGQRHPESHLEKLIALEWRSLKGLFQLQTLEKLVHRERGKKRKRGHRS